MVELFRSNVTRSGFILVPSYCGWAVLISRS
jgi:hypothetical protein